MSKIKQTKYSSNDYWTDIIWHNEYNDFSPNSISGLVLWLDANKSPKFKNSNGTVPAILDGDPIGYWGDLSGQGNHAIQATSNARAKLEEYSLGQANYSIYLDGIFGQLIIPTSLSVNAATISIFISLVPLSLWFTQGLINFPYSGNNLFIYSDGFNGNNWSTVGGVSSQSQPLTGLQTIGFISGASGSELRLNGVKTTAGQLSSSVMLGGVIGNWSSGTINGQFKIASIIVYNNAITDTQASNIESYMTRNLYYNGQYSVSKPLIAFDGNSITNRSSASNQNQGFVPTAISSLTTQNPYYENGVGGVGTPYLTSRFTTLYGLLYNSNRPQNILVFWEMTNDIGNGSNGTQAYNNVVTYCTQAKNQGWTIIALNCIKRGTYNSGQETARQTANSMLLADSTTSVATHIYSGASYLNYLIDIQADAAFSNPANTTYYAIDQVHPTSAGHAVIATYVVNALNLLGIN